MWKDYYLDHRSRIKFLVNKLRLSRNNSPIADPAPERASATVERQNSHIQPSSALSFLNHNISSERSTIDGLTARLAVGDSKPDIRILDGLSRSPSTSVSSTHERNIYTQKDSEYISWERSRKLAPKVRGFIFLFLFGFVLLTSVLCSTPYLFILAGTHKKLEIIRKEGRGFITRFSQNEIGQTICLSARIRHLRDDRRS